MTGVMTNFLMSVSTDTIQDFNKIKKVKSFVWKHESI